MRKYCLSYDAKNSKDEDLTKLKLDIVNLLRENGVSENGVSNPVASTIIFLDNIEPVRIKYWNDLIHTTFSDKIYYYLSAVALLSNGNSVIRDNGDQDLESNFSELIKR